MASRPNFGLNELDFVFSTLVFGSILNFTLMYLLAPAATSASATTPLIFTGCPNNHMFEPGSFRLMARCGTFVYKGALFRVVDFVARLAGTALPMG
ncbi:Protein RETICULATA-RELATED 2 chloroplastic [Bienertia sinuspersici]